MNVNDSREGYQDREKNMSVQYSIVQIIHFLYVVL